MANEPKKYGHITRDERVIIYHLLEQKVKPADAHSSHKCNP